jgi:hypothetical protein
MKKFILEWIASVKEQERIKKQKLKKDTEQVISDVLKHIEQRRKGKTKSDDYIF